MTATLLMYIDIFTCIFMVITLHQQYQSLYYPTNTHNVKNVEVLKHIKIMEAAPKCFGLQRNHHQEATANA